MLQRGDLVLVRAFGGKPHIRIVWEVTDEAVYVHSEKNYRQHLVVPESDVPWPVGFRWNAVYIADEELAHRIAAGDATWDAARFVNPELARMPIRIRRGQRRV